MFGLRSNTFLQRQTHLYHLPKPATAHLRPKPSLFSIRNGSHLQSASPVHPVNTVNIPNLSATASTSSTSDVSHAAYDGCQACANASYALSECAFIYPITPASSMCELFDIWSVGGRNSLISHKPVSIYEMESEAGAAGALHGSTLSGSLTTTFTASQGLLLMIPNLYELSGELLPCVVHVAARSLCKQALSIFGDHQDVMACRQSGMVQLCSNNTQECQDLSYISHMASLRCRLPFMHFFDGWRTSSVVNKIVLVNDADVMQMYPWDALKSNLRDKALNMQRPQQRGSAQGPDVYFQSLVANNKFYENAPEIIQDTMVRFGQITGRNYRLFEFYGDPNAERVVVMMGSGCNTAEQTIDEMNGRGEKVGLVKVRLFRPWSTEALLGLIAEQCPNVRKIAVMDRTREDGAKFQPLHLDILATLHEGDYFSSGQIDCVTGGQYGLSSKDLTPSMVRAIFDNLSLSRASGRMDTFVIGINDDVTHTSLNTYKSYELAGYDSITLPADTKQVLFWGMGSDGTIGANKQSIKDIEKHSDLFVQGYFSYDAHKSGGLTVSHLRFGPTPIKAEYEINDGADYTSVNNKKWLKQFDAVVKKCKQGGVLVINSDWNNVEDMDQNLPQSVKKIIAEKDLKLFNIDADAIAKAAGLGKRVNLIMQAVFYKIAAEFGLLPKGGVDGVEILKKSVRKMYESKGPKVIERNINGIEHSLSGIVPIEYSPDVWAGNAVLSEGVMGARGDGRLETLDNKLDSFVENVMNPMANLEGDQVKVSMFPEGGVLPEATSKHEQRAIALEIPQWDADKCTQCNYCSFVCPHAVIRPFLLDKDEVASVNASLGDSFETRKARASGSQDPLGNYEYSIQIAPLDCTGCTLCVHACKDDALSMVPFDTVKGGKTETALKNWQFATEKVTNKASVVNRSRDERMSVKRSQFEQPLLEFSGACAGCSETPYIKVVTQLFGKNVCIANATGCSSIWGGSAPNNPYSIPWANSLFEDNAEFGFGLAMGYDQRRVSLKHRLETFLVSNKDNFDAREDWNQLKVAIEAWMSLEDTETGLDSFASNAICNNLRIVCEQLGVTEKLLGDAADVLERQSSWIVGGDGWAYDIGFGGLDHILNQNKNLNIIVLDTEMYSNTGGQSSKSTPTSASVKFAEGGQISHKKDLGQIAMLYENVYVASVAMGADYDQTVRAMSEAESYPGTSLIIALSPCISWGMDMKSQLDSQKLAVDSGYWPLYRFDPRLASDAESPFQLDSVRIRQDLQVFLDSQNRFTKLARSNTNKATSLQLDLKKFSQHKHDVLVRHSLTDDEYLRYLRKKLGQTSDDTIRSGDSEILVLYGSETGNAAHAAQMVANEFKKWGSLKTVRLMSMDDLDFEELRHNPGGDNYHVNVVFVVSTCGQGEYPKNCKYFMADLKNCQDSLKHVNYCVFGLGDSHYVYFNATAKDLDDQMAQLGANRLIETGLGDDQDHDKYDSALEEWLPNALMQDAFECKLDDASQQQLVESKFSVSVLQPQAQLKKMPTREKPTVYLQDPFSHELAVAANVRVTPESYDRDFRQYTFRTEELDKLADGEHVEMNFDIGDCLGVWPENDMKYAEQIMDLYNLRPDDLLQVEQLDNKRKNLLIRCQDLFCKKLDIQGKPKRNFYQLLQMQPNIKAAEKERLDFLLSSDEQGKQALETLRNEEYANHIDLLYQFPSALPSLNHLVEYVPELKPRLYSIANSPKMHPHEIQLFVAKNDWHTKTGKEYREGVSTRYLENLDPAGDLKSVRCKIHGASIAMPRSADVPLVLVGLGCGVAPLRAYIQDRVHAEQQLGGKGSTGPMMLILGSRYEKYEYFYKNEFENYHDEGKGPLQHMLTAFSRDQNKKVYVMDRIDEYSKQIYEYLVEKEGYFYYCGAGGNVPYDVKNAVARALVRNGNFSEESAQEYILNMRLSGRYNIEAW